MIAYLTLLIKDTYKRAYKVKDLDKLHYCRSFCEEVVKSKSQDTIDIFEFINGIIRESENKR